MYGGKFNFYCGSAVSFVCSVYDRVLFSWLCSPSGPRSLHCWGFEITLQHTTLGRSPLDEWSPRRRDFYLTTHNTHRGQTSCPQRDSSLQFQQASDSRPTPYTAQMQGSANYGVGEYGIARKVIINYILNYHNRLHRTKVDILIEFSVD